MDEAFKQQVDSAGAEAGSNSVLVCECVKELADAHSLLACLEDHDVPLLQGLLMARAMPPVVSSRLVSSAAEREMVLHEAERSSGLRDLGQCIAVPSQIVATPGDASLLAYPGRYCVSRKCDGTRHLLLMTSGGQAYLLNRAGTLYRYPLQCSSSTAAVQSTEGSTSPIAQEAEEGGNALLPAGTVLDAWELPFAELYASILQQVQAGTVERTFDAGTGLEIFNYVQGPCEGAAGDVMALCRGLVLHPPSCTMVATPFVRLFELALWASAWLHEHSQVQQFEPRWTYLFEAVYQENTVVVQYPFEGLVLLGAMLPEGVELMDAAALQQQARRLSIMAVPSLSGPRSELLHQLSRRCCGNAPTSAGRQQRAASKGWVLMTAEGERHKLVQESYKCASQAAKALHPLAVWDAVLCGASSHQVLDHLPANLGGDARAVLDVLGGSYNAVLQQLQQQFERAQEQGLAQRSRQLVATAWGMEDEEAGGGSSSTLVELQGLMAGLSLTAPAGLGLSTVQEKGRSSSSRSAAFQAALRYVLLKGSRRAPSMYLDMISLSSKAFWIGNRAAPLLRSLILQCIRPDVDGSLPGYLPSPNVRQTSAKGWVAGPQVGRLAPTQYESPVELLPDVVLSHTLSMLEVRD
ncbi:hypothetical protein FOA52_003411 [Chlamydomonas sp. UWO 241]|nr:hypothetical protein FOA52_003411 [Chlamydomonas sp. UWO 241]